MECVVREMKSHELERHELKPVEPGPRCWQSARPRVGLPLRKFEARVRGIGLLLLHGVSFALSRVVRDVFVVAELALGQGDGILEVSQGAAGLRE